jgi:HPt (histidine-containing phosphotransfer) domain-containing protein
MKNKLYNLELIQLMANGDKTFVEKMVSLFIELTPALLNRLKLGIEIQDYKEIKLASHKMISSIDMMGIETLKPVIRSLEKMAIEKADISEIRLSVDFLEHTLEKVFDQLHASE